MKVFFSHLEHPQQTITFVKVPARKFELMILSGSRGPDFSYKQDAVSF